MATSACVIGSGSPATARSTLPTSLSAVVRISSRKIDSLVGKVEVDAAFGRLGGGRDVVHRGIPVAAPGEGVEGRVQDRSRRLRLCSAGSVRFRVGM